MQAISNSICSCLYLSEMLHDLNNNTLFCLLLKDFQSEKHTDGQKPMQNTSKRNFPNVTVKEKMTSD